MVDIIVAQISDSDLSVTINSAFVGIAFFWGIVVSVDLS